MSVLTVLISVINSKIWQKILSNKSINLIGPENTQEINYAVISSGYMKMKWRRTVIEEQWNTSDFSTVNPWSWGER